MRFPTLLVASLVLAAAGASTAQAGQGLVVIRCKNAQDAELLLDTSLAPGKYEVLNSAGAVVDTLSPGGTYYLPASGTVSFRFKTAFFGNPKVSFTILAKSGKAHLTYFNGKTRVDSLIGPTVAMASDGSVIVQ